jgi:hypothetical protein
MSGRDKEAPSWWDPEVGHDLRNRLAEMVDVKWLEELWIIGQFFARPEIPTARRFRGWMP